MRRQRSGSNTSRGSRGSMGSSSSGCTTVSREFLDVGDIDEIRHIAPVNETKVLLNAYKFNFASVASVYSHNLTFNVESQPRTGDVRNRETEVVLKGNDRQLYMKKKIINHLFDLLMDTKPEVFQKETAMHVYDRIRFLFSSVQIPDGSYDIPITDLSAEFQRFLGGPIRIQATVQYIARIEPMTVVADSRVADFYVETAFIQQQIKDENSFFRGNKYYDLLTDEQLRGFSLKKGHAKGVKHISDNDAVIVIDPKKTLFYADRPLLPFLMQRLNLRETTNLVSEPWPLKLAGELKNLVVYTTHRRHFFKVEDVVPQTVDTLFIEGDKSLRAYYFEKYQITLEHPECPCVVEKRKTQDGTVFNHYPLELLCIASAQRVPRDRIMKEVESDMIRACQELPLDKMDSIENEARKIPFGANPVFAKANIRCDRQLHSLKAVQLHPPNIEYKASAKDPASFSWNFLPSEKFVQPATINHMLVLYVNVHARDTNDFAGELRRICNAAGIVITRFSQEPCRHILIEDLVQLFKKKKDEEGVDFVLVIGGGQGFHDNLKFAELQTGVVTQQITKEVVLKGFRTETANNIMAKLNLKAGGRNYELGTTQTQILKLGKRINLQRTLMADTIVMGIYGSQQTVKTSEIYTIGYSATTTDSGNVTVGGYFYAPEAKPPLNPVPLGAACGVMLEEYMLRNKKIPKRVIMYRGGLALAKDVDYEAEVRHCGAAIKRVIQRQDPNAIMPNFTLVVALRQHTLRLLKNKNQINQSDRAVKQNVPSGTCTTGMFQDPNEFIIVSHKTLIGTARPALYKVLAQKGVPLNIDVIEQLTYNLCFMHEICSSPIAVPAPLRGAEELADRGTRNFANSNLSSSEPSNHESNELVLYCHRLDATLSLPLGDFKKRFWA